MMLDRMMAAAAIGVTMFALVACGDESQKESLNTAKAALAKSDIKAATVLLKSTLQQNPTSAEARFLLGKVLFDGGDMPGAAVELRKAQELKYPAEQVAPMLAKAMLSMLEDKKVTAEFGKFESTDPVAKSDVAASVALAFARQGQQAQAEATLKEALKGTPDHGPGLLVLARLEAGKGNLDNALSIVEGVLQKAPGSAEAHHLRGDLLAYGKRDLPKATESYLKTLSLQPGNVAAYTALMGIALISNDTAAAAKYYEAMAKALPNHPQTRFVEAQLAASKGDFKRASELLPPILKLAPENARVQQFAGFVELGMNSVGRAVSHLNKSIALAPELAPARLLLARAHLRSGQPDKALDTLRPLLAREMPDPESLTLAAEAHLLTGQVTEAEAFFQRAAKLTPTDSRVRTALALTQLARGRSEQGYAELQSIAASDKGTLADLALINARIRRQELGAALKAIDSLAAKEPASPIAPQLRGQIGLMRRDLKGARAEFEAALAKDPIYFPAVAALAKLDLVDKNAEAAQKRFEQVLKQDPNNLRAMLSLADLRARAGASKDEIAQWLDKAITANPTEPAPRLMLIDHWLSSGDPKAALAAAQAGLSTQPDSPEMLDALGRAQLAAGENQQAINTFGKLAILQPKSPVPLLRLARAQAYAKDSGSAVRSLGQALELAPELPAAQRDLLSLALQSRKADDALQVARRVQRQRPNDAVGFRLEGDIHAEFKDWDSAVKAYRVGLSKANPNALASRMYSVLSAAKKQAEADQFAAEWVKRQPADGQFISYLGDAYLSRQDYTSAQQQYLKAIKLDPNDAKSHNNLAWVMVKTKQAGAVAMAERAVQLAPGNATMLDTLSLALAEDKQLEKAIEAARAVLVLAPSQPAYRLSLAKLYLQSGNRAGAKEELSQLSKLGAKFAAQGEVAELLKGL